MLLVMVPLALILLGLVVYFAFSKKTGRMLRIAAFAALIVLLVSVLISLAFIFGIIGAGAGRAPVLADIPVEEAIPASGDTAIFLAFVVFILVLLTVIVVSLTREQRRKGAARKAGEKR
jgi:cytochrome bd-type quinol oxidase subunit 1